MPGYKIREMIKEVDIDENGTVEFQEFLTVSAGWLGGREGGRGRGEGKGGRDGGRKRERRGEGRVTPEERPRRKRGKEK